MIYELIIILIVLLGFSFFLNKKDIIAPSFVFCASFVFCNMWAVAYAKTWELGLHFNTFMVIVGGVLVFIICSFIVSFFYDGIRGTNYVQEEQKCQKIEIDKWKNIICLLFCAFSIVYTINSVIHAVGGSWLHFTDAINRFRHDTLFMDKTFNVSNWVSRIRIVVNAISYWYIYVIINNYIVEKKINILNVLIVISSAISSMTLGGRGGAVNIIFACVPITYTLMRKRYTFKLHIKFKTIIKLIVVGIVFLSTFQHTARLLGRSSNYDPMYYLAIYCGAEIKNLDLYLQEYDRTIKGVDKIWGSQTFIYVIRWLGPKLGYEDIYYQLDLPFRKVRGLNLGNVYTTFYPYIYDFGYSGSIILTALMAIISQILYEKNKRVKINNKPSLYIIVYGYIFTSLVQSFFSNKFYEQNLHKTFIYSIIIWNLFNFVLCNKESKANKKYNSI